MAIFMRRHEWAYEKSVLIMRNEGLLALAVYPQYNITVLLEIPQSDLCPSHAVLVNRSIEIGLQMFRRRQYEEEVFFE